MTTENIEPEMQPDQAPDTPAETQAPVPPQSEERIAALESELAQMKDQMLRALAEADNIRKRALKEREDAQKFAIIVFVRDMLDIADNFRRAMDAIPAEAKTGDDFLMKTLLEGIDAVERNMLRIFERHGIKKIEPLDQMFDPNFHEVMFEAPIPGKPAGTVIQLVEPGYTLNDRLLRPARVGVAKDDGTNPKTHVDQTA